VPCVASFFADARACAGVTAGVECAGFNCYDNGARTFTLAAELRDPADALCLKRWTTVSGSAWQTGDRELRFDTAARSVLCPDGSSHATTDPTMDEPSACDPIDEPLRACAGTACAAGTPVCPAEGCLCRESACAREFFDEVRACAGLTGSEPCTYDETLAVSCYSNGARVVGDAEDRELFAPDGTLCMTVSVGPVTFPSRAYTGQRDATLVVDDTGMVVTCADHVTEQDACGSPARENFDDSCDPSYIFDPAGCCPLGSCE
jgi:hypothetical protein